MRMMLVRFPDVTANLVPAGAYRITDVGPRSAFFLEREDYIGLVVVPYEINIWPDTGDMGPGWCSVEYDASKCVCQCKLEPAV